MIARGAASPLARIGAWLGGDPTPPSPDAMSPPRGQRIATAIAVAVLAGTFAGLTMLRPGAVPDLLYPLTAARHLLDGTNPYLAMPGREGAAPPYDEPLLYPLTTVLALLPLARLPLALAGGLLIGVSSGVLAYLITRDGQWRLHVFASAPFVVAATLGQLSPLLLTMAFVPSLGVLGTLKPNLGLALFGYRPSWRALLGGAAFVVISLLVLPAWPRQWLLNLQHQHGVHRAPLLEGVGLLLAVAAVRWRTPAGRLLLLMSLVPQGLFFSDQLPLWLVPWTRRQSIALTASSQLALMLWYLMRGRVGAPIPSAYPFVIVMIYLPALAIVLLAPRAAPEGGGATDLPPPTASP